MGLFLRNLPPWKKLIIFAFFHWQRTLMLVHKSNTVEAKTEPSKNHINSMPRSQMITSIFWNLFGRVAVYLILLWYKSTFLFTYTSNNTTSHSCTHKNVLKCVLKLAAICWSLLLLVCLFVVVGFFSGSLSRHTSFRFDTFWSRFLISSTHLVNWEYCCRECALLIASFITFTKVRYRLSGNRLGGHFCIHWTVSVRLFNCSLFNSDSLWDGGMHADLMTYLNTHTQIFTASHFFCVFFFIVDEHKSYEYSFVPSVVRSCK